MKSFADWTQEIADSVGEVQHHWETRKEADVKGITIKKVSFDIEDAVQPGWPVPSPDPGIITPTGFHCERCMIRDGTVQVWESPSIGDRYYFCTSCGTKLGFVRNP